MNLFAAYQAVGDKNLSAQMDAYNEGTNYTPATLMDLAKNKYSSLMEDNT